MARRFDRDHEAYQELLVFFRHLELAPPTQTEYLADTARYWAMIRGRNLNEAAA